MPGHTDFDLLQINVHATQHELSNSATVTISLAPFHINLLAKDKIRQGIFRLLTIGLRLFRSVNSCQSDFVLCFIGVNDSDRVTIGHAHHQSMDDVGQGHVA